MNKQDSLQFIKLNSIEDLNNIAYRGKLVSFIGLISSMGQIYPEKEKITFECRSCMQVYTKNQNITIGNKKIVKPVKCDDCGSTLFDIVNEAYVDVQIVEITDIDELKNGKSVTTTLILTGNLVDKVNLGDLVEINGIVETNRYGKKYNPFVSAKKIDEVPKTKSNIIIKQNDKKTIEKLAKEPKILNMLVESFTPSIKGFNDIKEALILQLFSIDLGVSFDIKSGIPLEYYFKPINILLVGDTALKREMLKFTAKTSPTGIFIVGNKPLSIIPKNKSKFGKNLLESGVLILADRSILCIDNINSLHYGKDDIKIAMESQIINVSIKSNGSSVSTTMPTHTSMLVGISPKKELNQRTPVNYQIYMNQDLFSEFDLVFVLNNIKLNDNTKNLQISEDEYSENSGQIQLSESMILKYIYFANKFKPQLDDENVKNCLLSFFLDLRKDFGSYLINDRKFNSLIELAKASARIHLRNNVAIEDAKTAIRVYINSLKSMGIDLDEDQPNINMIMSRDEKKENQKIIDNIINDIVEKKEELSLNKLVEEMLQKSDLTERLIRILITDSYTILK